MLNVFVLTYSGSKFTPEFFPEDDVVESFKVVKNSFDVYQAIPATTALAFQAQVTAFELFRLFARGPSREQMSRSAVACLKLLEFPFSRRVRSQVSRSVLKSKAVRHGHELLWGEAIKSDKPSLLLEDDAKLDVEKSNLFGALLELASSSPKRFGVELSRSFSFQELGISRSQVAPIAKVEGLGNVVSVSPGASNTTCAAFYSHETIEAMIALSEKCFFDLLPIDYFIDYFYLINRKTVKNFHLTPGAFLQGSEFRQAP